MPLFFINPSKKRRSVTRRRPVRHRRLSIAAKPRRTKKLRGAVKARFLRRMAKGRRAAARKSSPKRRVARRVTKSITRRRRVARVHRPSKKAAARRIPMAKRKHRRSRKRHTTHPVRRVRRRRGRKANPFTSRTARAAARKRWAKNPARKHRRRRARRNPAQRGDVGLSMALSARHAPRKRRKSGQKALRKAQSSIRYAKRRRGAAGRRAKGWLKQYGLRSNPRRRRHRRNPGGAVVSALTGTLKAALPVVGGLYLSRFIAKRFGGMIPGLSSLDPKYSSVAVSAVLVVAAHYGTKSGPLAKYRSGIMLGAGINLVDSLVKAVAPDSIKAMIGLSDAEVYDEALGDYVEMGQYQTEMGDYVEMSDYVETGAMEELGMMEDLGAGIDVEYNDALDRPKLGGARRMIVPVPTRRMVTTVPTKNYERQVPEVGAGYDSNLQTGIFGGGFGN